MYRKTVYSVSTLVAVYDGDCREKPLKCHANKNVISCSFHLAQSGLASHHMSSVRLLQVVNTNPLIDSKQSPPEYSIVSVGDQLCYWCLTVVW